jgi:hypothetical protein
MDSLPRQAEEKTQIAKDKDNGPGPDEIIGATPRDLHRVRGWRHGFDTQPSDVRSVDGGAARVLPVGERGPQ